MLDLGKTIQALREQKGMSQKELAKRAGVSTGAIGNYEAGLRRPKFETNEMQTKKGPLMCANIINDPAPEVLRTVEKEHKKEPPAMQRSFTG